MTKPFIFAPLGWLYEAAANARRKFYERGIFKSADLETLVISVGNITFGGTGKTPLVAYIAEILAARGERVCVLTRGYKRANEKTMVVVSDGEKILAGVRESGDEPFELAQKLLKKSAVVADANRARAGRWARENLGVTAFILDDGFQHLKVKRDLDIVCIDASNPFGGGKKMTRGILREPLKNLSRAGAIVITRANLVEDVSKLKAQISKLSAAKIFVSKNKFSDAVADKKKSPAAAFCALGNPQNFFDQLRRENFKIVLTKTFPDHHFYTQREIEELEKEALKNGAEILATTPKDAVKLSDLKFKLPLIKAESGIVFDDEIAFRKMVLNHIKTEEIN